jgi:predicted RNase H-like HicB family nuclease
MTKIDLYERKVFFSREDKCWIAVAPELQGCSAHGKTPEKALKELDIAMEGWLEITKEKGWAIPEPLANKEPAGRILLRLPKTLHHDFLSMAKEEGVSLNQFMLYILARYKELGRLARHTR